MDWTALAPPQANPWTTEVMDLESLHAEATQAVIESVAQLRAAAERGVLDSGRPLPMVLLGPAGIGKTHLFARLRKRLQGKAVFVHVRPAGTEMTARFLLGQILEQLGYESCGIRQIDALVGAIIARQLDGDPAAPQGVLDLLASLSADGREAFLEHLIERAIERHADLDEAYLRLLLRTPFLPPLARSAALAWLGGRELDDMQAKRIRVPEILAEDRVVPALRTLARAAAPMAPLLLVFDQLENLIDGTGHRIRAYGNLVSDLVDVVRDGVIVQMALDTEWEEGLKPRFALSQLQRLGSRRFLLGMPSARQVKELIQLWGHHLPGSGKPYPWPFSERHADSLCQAGSLTPRALLIELRRVLEEGESELNVALPSQDAISDLLDERWQEHVQQVRAGIDASAEAGMGLEEAFLSDGIALLAGMVDGLATEAAGETQGLCLEVAGEPLRIAFVLGAHHRSIGATLSRLGSLPGPMLAIREQWRDFKPTWKTTREQWLAFVGQPRVRWHWLSRRDAEHLLALASLLKDARSGDIPGPDGHSLSLPVIKTWVQDRLDPGTWEISEAIRGGSARLDEPPAQAMVVPVPSRPGTSSRALAHLGRLGIASLERLEGELRREGVALSRAELLAELRAGGDQVTWFGPSLACSLE